MKIETKVIHMGNEPDKETGAIIPPLFQTSTYVQTSPGEHRGYEYTRSHNPTRTRLERCLASLEHGQYALTTASGMAAIGLIMHLLPKKSKILCGDDVYGGTYRLMTTVFHDYHHIVFVDTAELAEPAGSRESSTLEKIIEKERPNLIWIETPTNPLLKITDIKKISRLAQKVGGLLVVDNTFMSPYFQTPLNLGADLVIHSMTKYLNGHSDVVAGAIILNDEKIYEKLWALQNSTGPTPSPFDSWLVLRGIKTLAVRMEAHQANAIKIARWLQKHPLVENVIYPGLENHPQYKISKEQMTGFGGMITFFLKSDLKGTKRFLENVEIFSLAESLGGVESLIEHPATMTHGSLPTEVRLRLGIKDNGIRLSVGIENADDLIGDLAHAFSSC